jgi:hypothetical protein
VAVQRLARDLDLRRTAIAYSDAVGNEETSKRTLGDFDCLSFPPG